MSTYYRLTKSEVSNSNVFISICSNDLYIVFHGKIKCDKFYIVICEHHFHSQVMIIITVIKL